MPVAIIEKVEEIFHLTKVITCVAFCVLASGFIPDLVVGDEMMTDTSWEAVPSGMNVSAMESSSDSGFETRFTGIPVSEADDGFDPLVFHKHHFSDGQYRVIFKNDPFGIDETQLWKTPDFSSWTKVANSIAGDADQFEDHIVLSDGTFVLYQSPNQNGGTSVWTGEELTNLTKQGTPIPEPDGGVFYDEATGTIHIYTEDQDNTTGAGSDKLSHWTTPDDDLLDATKQRDALDLTGKSWHTGDPDIIEISGVYYMFTDNTTNHPNYRIAVFRSTNLYDWTLVQNSINPQRSGGDMTVTRYDGSFVGFTEYDNYTDDRDFGVGQWEVSFLGRAVDQKTRIAVTGGGVGGLGRNFQVVPGEDNQAVGVLRLQPDSTGATLSGLTIHNDTTNTAGIRQVGLFGSFDRSFDPSEDARLATKSTNGGIPSEVSFSSLNDSLRTDRYLFLTVSLTRDARGTFSASVQSQGDFAFNDGRIGSVNGTDQITFQNLALSGSSSPLPVELAGFEARFTDPVDTGAESTDGLDEEAVLLQWRTTSETGNAGFAIERRQVRGGAKERTRSSWQMIDFVESKVPGGTSSEARTYQFRDERLPFEADRLEYRLRQIDIDGSERVSETVAVERGAGALRLLAPHPNPARSQVAVRYTVPDEEEQKVKLRLYDTLGRRVRSMRLNAKPGRHERSLSVSGLASGAYILRISRAEQSVTRKIMVVR